MIVRCFYIATYPPVLLPLSGKEGRTKLESISIKVFPSSLRKGKRAGEIGCVKYHKAMHIPVREYKQLIKQRARKLRNNPTDAEKAMWNILRLGRLKGLRFLRQHPILFHINNNVHFFIPDFYCPQYKLIIEVDGDIHNKEKQKEEDAVRTGMLEDMGYKLVRFKNKDVIESAEFVTRKVLSFTT